MHVIFAGRTFQCDLRGCRKQWELDTSTLGPAACKVKDPEGFDEACRKIHPQL
jgi:hypothetical protein